MTASQLDKMRLELRRGVLVLAVLSSLKHPHYGYSLRQQLHEAGIEMDEGTLYPLVRRLADQGLLVIIALFPGWEAVRDWRRLRELNDGWGTRRLEQARSTLAKRLPKQ